MKRSILKPLIVGIVAFVATYGITVSQNKSVEIIAPAEANSGCSLNGFMCGGVQYAGCWCANGTCTPGFCYNNGFGGYVGNPNVCRCY